MRKILLAFIVLCLSVDLATAQSNSQAFDWAFNTKGGMNTVRRLVYNSKGDLIVMGTVSGTGAFGNIPLNGEKVGNYPGFMTYIGKRTQSGQFTVLIQKPSKDFGATFEDFTLDAQDNIILTGGVNTPGGAFDFGNGVKVGEKGFFITKFDPTGKALWSKLYDLGTNMTASTQPKAVGAMNNGDIFYALYSPNDHNPFWLIKLRADGTEIWHKEYSGLGHNLLASKNNMFFDNAGNTYFHYYVTNTPSLTINGETITAPAGTVHTYFLAFDPNGNKKFFKGLSGAMGDMAVEKETGNILIEWVQLYPNPEPFNTLPVMGQTSTYAGLVALDASGKFLKSSPSLDRTKNTLIESIYPLGDFKVVGPEEHGIDNNKTYIWTEGDENLVPKYSIMHPTLSGSSGEINMSVAVFKNKVAVSGTFDFATNPTISINGTTLTASEKDLDFGKRFPQWAFGMGDVFIAQFDRSLQGGTTVLSAPLPVSPSNGTMLADTTVTLRWNSVAGAIGYHLQLSTDSTFAGNFLFNDSTITDTTKFIAGLSYSTQYFWRVRAMSSGKAFKNDGDVTLSVAAPGEWSQPGAFKTPAKNPNSIADNFEKQFRINHYPNPASNSAIVEFTLLKESHVKISLLNSLGKEISHILNETRYSGENTILLKTEELSAGMYYMQFDIDGARFIRAVAIVK